MHYLYIYTRNILTNESYSNGDQSSQNTGYFQGRTVNWEVSHHVKSQFCSLDEITKPYQNPNF